MPAPSYSAPDRWPSLSLIYSGGWANAAATNNFVTFGRPGPTADRFDGYPLSECSNVFSNHETGDDWHEFICTPNSPLMTGQRARAAWGGFMYTASSLRLDQDWEIGMQVKLGPSGYGKKFAAIGFILARQIYEGTSPGTLGAVERIDSYLEPYLSISGTQGTPTAAWIRPDNVSSNGSYTPLPSIWADDATKEYRANYNILGKQLEVGQTGDYGPISLGAPWETAMIANGIRNQIGNEAFVGVWWSTGDNTDSIQGVRISAFSIHGTAGSRRIVSTGGVAPTSGTPLVGNTDGVLSRMSAQVIALPGIRVAGLYSGHGSEPITPGDELTGQIFPRGLR